MAVTRQDTYLEAMKDWRKTWADAYTPKAPNSAKALESRGIAPKAAKLTGIPPFVYKDYLKRGDTL